MLALFFYCCCISALVCLTSGTHVQPTSQGFVPGTPLPMPDNPEQQCKQHAFHDFSVHNPRCTEVFWKRWDPDAECCEGLADYFGAASVKTSRNCWCVPEIWDWMATTSEKAFIQWQTIALVCSRMGYIIPFYVADEAESESGGGYCNGTAPTQDALDSAVVDDHSRGTRKPLSQWLSDLDKNGLVHTSLAVSIMSAVGLSLMVWPILYELVMAAKESWSGSSAASKRYQ